MFPLLGGAVGHGLYTVRTSGPNVHFAYQGVGKGHVTDVSSLKIKSNLSLDSVLSDLATTRGTALAPVSGRRSSFATGLDTCNALGDTLAAFRATGATLSGTSLFSTADAADDAATFDTAATNGTVTKGCAVDIARLTRTRALAAHAAESSAGATVTADSDGLAVRRNNSGSPVAVSVDTTGSSLDKVHSTVGGTGTNIDTDVVGINGNRCHLSIASGSANLSGTVALSIDNSSTLRDFVNCSTDTDDGNVRISITTRGTRLAIGGITVRGDDGAVDSTLRGVALGLGSIAANGRALAVARSASGTRATVGS